MSPIVCFILPTLRVGGAERMVQTLVNELPDTWQRVVLCMDQPDTPMRLTFKPEVQVIKIPARRTRYSSISLVKHIRILRPDIIFSSWSRTNLLVLALRPVLPPNCRIVLREPNLPSHTLPSLSFSRIYQLSYRFLYPRAQMIICQSQLMLRELQEDYGVPSCRLSVLSNILSLDEIIGKSRECLPQSVCSNTDVVACGRLVPQKGFDMLIDSFAMIRDEHRDSRLIILGEGDGAQNQRPHLEAKVASLGLKDRVFLPGATQNPYKYMARCALFVSSSLWEGLPNVVLEAMACGANIVATNCPGGTQEIISHGINGWLTPAGDKHSLARAMSNVLSAKWRLDPQDIKRFAILYDKKTQVPRFNATLSSVLD